MVPLQKIAAVPVISHAIVVIMNPGVAVYLTIVQMAQNNAREEFHRHVPVAYGQVAQNAVQIRFAMAVPAVHVVQTSMYMAIHAKTTAPRTVERTEIVVVRLRMLRQQHAMQASARLPNVQTTIICRLPHLATAA